MIIAKQFAFIHLPKTGGTWLRDAMSEHRHSHWHLRERPGHHPARTAPQDRRKRTLLSCIRNPWDWYVSTYFFRRDRIMSNDGAWHRPRKDWNKGMTAWAELMPKLPDGKEGFLQALPLLTGDAGGDPLVPDSDGVGSLSKRYADYLCDERGRLLCEVIRFENIRAEAERFFVKHRIPMTGGFQRALRSAPPKNTSKRGPYRDYYDDAARDLVARADRAIIKRYGYEF